MKLFSNPKTHLLIVFFLALSLRLYGLNWDQGQHLHPDERFLTMVGTTIQIPKSIFEYFNTDTSPLNPYNHKDFQFFVYGTFPLFLVKYLAVFLEMDTYSSFNLVGRAVSAVFDSLSVFCLIYLAGTFTKSKRKYLPALFYTFAVLPIQQAHFFTVDTFLSFFLLLTFTLLSARRFVLSAIAFGLAIACKISAVYFSPIVIIFLLFYFHKNIHLFLRTFSYILLLTFIVFRIFQPYSFVNAIKPNPQFIANLKTLNSYNDPSGFFPPSIQWLDRLKVIFPLQNIIFWGIGLPLSLIFIISLFSIRYRFPKISNIAIAIFWVILLFGYQSLQFTYTMRYFLPIYPFICLIITYLAVNVSSKVIVPLIVLHCLWGILFISIYSRPHSRVQATNWIYQNIPSGVNITNEYWDDPLPLYLPGHDPNIYHGTMLSLYDPDIPEKWQKLSPFINQTDYLIMSSNRLWGSISRVPQRYPITAKFYQDLFAGNLNFKKLIEINSYPGLSIPFLEKCYYFGPTDFPGVLNHWLAIDSQCSYPGVYLRDDTAEEAFTVFDHAKVLIYQRVN